MLGNLLNRFKKGLAKTREGMFGKIKNVILRHPKLDEEALEEIEDILIQADIGVDMDEDPGFAPIDLDSDNVYVGNFHYSIYGN